MDTIDLIISTLKKNPESRYTCNYYGHMDFNKPATTGSSCQPKAMLPKSSRILAAGPRWPISPITQLSPYAIRYS